MAVERMHVIFTGCVQGVYFRATTAEIARILRVTGFVRNLPDGTVELEAQGPTEDLESLLAGLHDRYGTAIENVHRRPIPVLSADAHFEIRR
ncbi:MAG: acylphosphatase [Planctomycetes bacterium]|nr:acylphosphatase [Planctomycetota bacterium]